MYICSVNHNMKVRVAFWKGRGKADHLILDKGGQKFLCLTNGDKLGNPGYSVSFPTSLNIILLSSSH